MAAESGNKKSAGKKTRCSAQAGQEQRHEAAEGECSRGILLLHAARGRSTVNSCAVKCILKQALSVFYDYRNSRSRVGGRRVPRPGVQRRARNLAAHASRRRSRCCTLALLMRALTAAQSVRSTTCTRCSKESKVDTCGSV